MYLIVHLGRNVSTWIDGTSVGMDVTWISRGTTTTVILTMLQIQALLSDRTVVTGVEGQRFDFRCEYPSELHGNAKYFSQVDENASFKTLIRTETQNVWVEQGRFSMYDNTSEAFFIVGVDKLFSEDSGTYQCGVDISLRPDYISVIQLHVFRETATPPYKFPRDLTVDRLHLPLYLTAVMCVAAMLCVCLFTLCLLLSVRHRRSGPNPNREMSSDYETMMPNVRTELELCSCSAPDRSGGSASPLPPPDLYSHLTSNNRESTVTLGLGEYVDVDVPRPTCQYQHLDISRLEDHVYYSLHANSGPKDVPTGVKGAD